MEDNASLKLLIFPDFARVNLLLKAVGFELSAMHQWIYCCPDSSPRECVIVCPLDFSVYITFIVACLGTEIGFLLLNFINAFCLVFYNPYACNSYF